MTILRQLIVLSVLLLAVLSSPTRQQPQDPQDPSHHPAEGEDFQRLLADVDENSIHSALHRWSSKFQDGVFSRDRTALEAIRSENAPIATSLLHLAKRQASNDTVTTTPSSSAEPSEPPPSSTPAPPLPESSESGSQTPDAPPETSSDVVSPPASTDVTTPATRAPTTEAVPVSTPSAAVPIATSEGRIVFSVSASGGSSGRLTTVDATSKVVSFGRPSSSLVLSTITLPDGSLSTQTSVTFVDAPITAGGGGAGQSNPTATDGGGAPGLQNGVASATKGLWKEVVAVMGGAVVMGLAI